MPKLLSVARSTYMAGALLLMASAPAFAADPVQQHNSNAVWFENWIGLSNATLTVTVPDGTITVIAAKSGTPIYELDRANAPDGVYRYELTAATEKEVKIVNAIDQGRGDAQRDTQAAPFYASGSFTVERGVIITPKEINEEDG
ncbi:MAG: hypothetical protein QNJ09_01875 [Paracoccaceae bacterium]|nr:hypothetical protein [Paracoccaceae bacterium]